MSIGAVTQLAVLRRIPKSSGVYFILNDGRTNVKGTTNPARPYVCLSSECLMNAHKATSCRHVVAARLFDRMHPGSDEVIAEAREFTTAAPLDPAFKIKMEELPCWGCGKPVGLAGAYYCTSCDPATGGDAEPMPWELSDEQRDAMTDFQNDAARRRHQLPEGRRKKRAK